MSVERAAAFDFLGPKTLIGPELKPGDAAPDFTLVGGKGALVSKSAFTGKPMLISVVPSLDTGVCSKQTVRFNESARDMGDKAHFLTVSADLPFAQSRWCGANGADNVQALSDHRDMNFGNAYGTHIKDLRIESRAVFVVDAQGVIRYAEYVPVAGEEPNYDAALVVLRELAG
ncbi:MAG: thiol peroxidase [Chloroflexales bacterium]|nr:thiol peroxidase [Chloroflexales bacterium]